MGDEILRKCVLNTIWRSMCLALKYDPLETPPELGFDPVLTEERAAPILRDLKAGYEDPAWAKRSRELARQCHFEHRSFLINLRSLAFEVQKPILLDHGFEASQKGLRRLEVSLLQLVKKSADLDQQLQSVRRALLGGDDSMYTINLEGSEILDETTGKQLRSLYMQSDPFGGHGVNTNAVIHDPIAA
eukprot:NODE_3618_length_763_cov_327.135593.p1 GENE.NODE_3618_length_763_cov_327.135593~~NODE_3618_length_763_cov_327.135593.p1  ORF type:complete len:188 (+),score=68.68 NODE_3618_length_763_cov_327.135593:3-566(+)